jgi:4-hydroxy-3-polyprenylbenzoate decarboxylase
MGTLGRIAHGFAEDSMTRTADVMLKEKKQLILVPRETPFSLIHLENMRLLALAGATLIPAIPSYYSHPQTIDDVAATVSSRILDHLGFTRNSLMPRWYVDEDQKPAS